MPFPSSRPPSALSPSAALGGGGPGPATLLAVAALVSALGVPTIVTQCSARHDEQESRIDALTRRVEILEERERARGVSDERHEVLHMRERQELQSELQGFYSRIRGSAE